MATRLSFIALRYLTAQSLLNQQLDTMSLLLLDRVKFIEVVQQSFRRHGFTVVDDPRPGEEPNVDVSRWEDRNLYLVPDTSDDWFVDFRLRKGKKVYVVHCKRWRVRTVAAGPVSQLSSLITHEKANGGFVITCGKISDGAKELARQRSITPVDGSLLWRTILSVRSPVTKISRTIINERTVCPECEAELNVAMNSIGIEKVLCKGISDFKFEQQIIG